jgi:hypothetical protein
MTQSWPLNETHMTEQEKGPHVVLSGTNPALGFVIYGPFPDWRTALMWLDRACDGNGWIQPLEKPE